MITSNDLFDLHYSFVLIRDNISCPQNAQILKTISTTVLSQCDSDNSIRKALSQIGIVDSEKWRFVFCENVYTFRKLITNQKAMLTLSKICAILCQLIEEEKFEQAYDFADSIHFVPLIIEKNMKISVRKLKKLTREYRKKWKEKRIYSIW